MMYILLYGTWKIQFKKNVTPRELEQYMSFSFDNKLVFSDSF